MFQPPTWNCGSTASTTSVLPRSIVRDSERLVQKQLAWVSTAALLAPSVPDVKIIRQRVVVADFPRAAQGRRTSGPRSSRRPAPAAGTAAASDPGRRRHGLFDAAGTQRGGPGPVRQQRARACRRGNPARPRRAAAGGRRARAARRVPGVRAARTAGRGPAPPWRRRRKPRRDPSCCRSGWRSGPPSRSRQPPGRPPGGLPGVPARRSSACSRGHRRRSGAGWRWLRSVVQRPRVCSPSAGVMPIPPGSRGTSRCCHVAGAVLPRCARTRRLRRRASRCAAPVRPPGKNSTTRMNRVPRMNKGSDNGIRRMSGSGVDGVGVRERREALVQDGVEDARRSRRPSGSRRRPGPP